MKQNDIRQNFRMSYAEALCNSKVAVIAKDTDVQFIDTSGNKKRVHLFKGDEVTYLMTVRRCALVKCRKTENPVVSLALFKVNFKEV